MRRWIVYGIILAMVSAAVPAPAAALSMPWVIEQWLLGAAEEERAEGFFTIVDERGAVLDQTARGVSIGDQLITEDNRVYEMVQVQGDTVVAKHVGNEQIVWKDEWDPILAQAALAQAEAAPQRATGQTEVKGQGSKVAVYHTHSDESYVPTDGKSSIYGNGGIFVVGDKLQDNLAKSNVQVLYSKKAHDPHDRNAYHRSRRTAIDLMKQNPVALIDVHRDATPPQQYAGRFRGEEITKIKLVVGRSNPKFQTNMTFAKRMKAVLDKTHPGLIKSIYVGRGNYNQDLSPRSILIEVGAHSNPREAAERGVAYFAEAIPTVLGIEKAEAATGTGATTGEENRSNWSALGWILLVLALAVGGFLLVSTGSLKGSIGKLKQFGSSEWANFLGKLPRRKK